MNNKILFIFTIICTVISFVLWEQKYFEIIILLKIGLHTNIGVVM